MKRVSCIILIILVLSHSIAFSESFEVRNGIHFGMTKEEVIAVEEQNGNSADSVYDGNYIKDGLTYQEVTIAGIPGSRIDYYFDEGGLNEIVYWLGSLDVNLVSEQAAYSTFLTMESALSEKYGEYNYCADDGSTPKAVTHVLEGLLDNPFLHLMDYRQWSAQYDGYSVIIDEAYFYLVNMSNETEYRCEIGYRRIGGSGVGTSEEINNDI